MSRQISANALREVLAQQTAEVFLVCLRIEHPSVSTIRVVYNTESIVRSDGIYVPFAFSVQLPDDVSDRLPTVAISFENISLEILRALRNISGVPKVTILVVTATTPDVVEVGPLEFSLLSITYNAKAVSGVLGFQEDILSRAVPLQTYTPTNSKGIFS